MEDKTIYNAYKKAGDQLFSPNSNISDGIKRRRDRQYDAFEDEMWNRLPQALADCEYFWHNDFDYNESKEWLPKNFLQLPRLEQAKLVIQNAPGWTSDDFANYLWGNE